MEVLNYLDFLHLDGCGYSVINTHKSMSIQTLHLCGVTWCGKPRWLARFIIGIFNSKPPKPRYTYTWDVSIVLKYLYSLFPLENLSLKLLTLKLVALIALTSATSAQTLIALDIRNMRVSEDTAIFQISTLLKSSRVGNPYQQILLKKYTRPELCVLNTLMAYLRRTKNVRKSENLFI
jgi:hypothetical protein